jgi:hypothetical protein
MFQFPLTGSIVHSEVKPVGAVTGRLGTSASPLMLLPDHGVWAQRLPCLRPRARALRRAALTSARHGSRWPKSSNASPWRSWRADGAETLTVGPPERTQLLPPTEAHCPALVPGMSILRTASASTVSMVQRPMILTTASDRSRRARSSAVW